MRTEHPVRASNIPPPMHGAPASRMAPVVCWRPHWLLMLALFFMLMLIAGSVPGHAQALSARFGDVLLHASAYGFMTVLCMHALHAAPVLRLLLTIGVIALLGLIDESLQSLLPYRNASALDWCSDIAAAAIVATPMAWHARLHADNSEAA